MDYKKQSDETKNLIKSALSKDSSKEDIDRVNSIIKGIEEMDKIHSKTETDYNQVKSDYIEVIRKGNSIKPNDDTDKSDIMSDDDSFKNDLNSFLKNNQNDE